MTPRPLSGITNIGTNNIGTNNIGYNTYAMTGTVATDTGFKTSTGLPVLEIPANQQAVKITGKLLLNDNDEDVGERLKRIEDMLHIPQRSVIMEQKYTKLRELWEEYNETLAAIKTWETIKK